MPGARQRLRTMAKAAIGTLPPPRDRAAADTLLALRDLVTGSTRRPRPLPPGQAVRRMLDRAYASGDPDRWRAAVEEVHRLREHAERLATPPWAAGGAPVSSGRGVQSTQFMIDLLPHLQALMAEHPRGTAFDILDVGPGTGMGTALLSQLYRTSQLGYRAEVSALDISTIYERFLPTVAPRVPFIRQDVFEHEKTYDIVIASHVIEHLDDPVAFCRRLQQIARLGVFVVCPFKEPADRLTRGHVRSIDEDLVARLAPQWHLSTHSVSWGAFADPPYEMLIARLPGLAATGSQARPEDRPAVPVQAAVPVQTGSPVSVDLDTVRPVPAGVPACITLPPDVVTLPQTVSLEGSGRRPTP